MAPCKSSCGVKGTQIPDLFNVNNINTHFKAVTVDWQHFSGQFFRGVIA